MTTGDDTVAPWVTTGVPPGGATSQKDELEAVRAELLEQLKGENQFLRAALEQRDRDAAELRAALRKALEIAPRQLPIGDTAEGARQAATPPPEVETMAATTEANLQTPPKVVAGNGRKEPRPLWKVILGLR